MNVKTMVRQLLSVVLAVSVPAAVSSARSKSRKYDKTRRPGSSSPASPASSTSPASSESSKPAARYNPVAERIKFFTAAGKDSELSDKEYNADKAKGAGFVRKTDSWSAMLKYDKDGNKTIDWFEADAYRRAQSKASGPRITTLLGGVAASGTSPYAKMSKEQIWAAMTRKYDRDGDGKLHGKEKYEAYKEYKQIRLQQAREERERRYREKKERDGSSQESAKPIEATFGGHRYKVLRTRVSWQEAVKHCADQGGHLVTIESAAELAFVKKLAGYTRLWVGANDMEKEGHWVWLTGRPVPQARTVWRSGEPNGGKTCNYASITSAGLYDSSSPYASVKGLICEWDK